MADNYSAFDFEEYDRKILQTVPYYQEFDKIKDLAWMDVGCGTEKTEVISIK